MTELNNQYQYNIGTYDELELRGETKFHREWIPNNELNNKNNHAYEYVYATIIMQFMNDKNLDIVRGIVNKQLEKYSNSEYAIYETLCKDIIHTKTFQDFVTKDIKRLIKSVKPLVKKLSKESLKNSKINHCVENIIKRFVEEWKYNDLIIKGENYIYLVMPMISSDLMQLDKSYLDGYEYIKTASELYELTLNLMQNDFDN